MLPVSVALLIGLGAWQYQYRRADVWERLGVAAMLARFWTYHRLYDDVIVVVALVALTRLMLQGQTKDRAMLPTLLLGVTILFILLPARLGIAPAPWYLVFNGGHTLTWLAVLGFLMYEAQREKSAHASLSTV